MGTDIHMVVEVKVGKKWEVAHDFYPCHRCAGRGRREDRDEAGEKCYLCKGTGFESSYSDRNYNAFAIMADVRNVYGFAGIPTGEPFPVIAKDRGLPDDWNPNRKFYGRHDDDGDAEADLGDHSVTWLTLQELEDYPWTPKRETVGVVSAAEYIAFKKNGIPSGWCGDAFGPNTRNITNDEMEALIVEVKRMGFDPEKIQNTYTKVSWSRDYASCVGEFYTDFIPALRKLAADKGVAAKDVRLVMGFDS